jgi:hypothetical protein
MLNPVPSLASAGLVMPPGRMQADLTTLRTHPQAFLGVKF